jgi:hypothetical protein
VELVLHLADAPARAFQVASRQAGRPVRSLRTDDRRGEAERPGWRADADPCLANDDHAAEVPWRQARLFHQARSSRRMSWQGR